MWWQYVLVFLGAFLFDVVPFPFLPAFTIMLFLQVVFDLNLWAVIIIGVAGSILGRYILTLYIPRLSDKYFKPAKNEDIVFLGKTMKDNGWKSQLVIIAYSLLPLPTTPLFVAGGIAKIKPLYIIPAFFVGKFTSDATALSMGKYASENVDRITTDIFSWQSITGLTGSLLLLSALLFIDWRTLIQKKKFLLKFKIFK
jgi:membrane protein DedA with SNARE-associated domain